MITFNARRLLALLSLAAIVAHAGCGSNPGGMIGGNDNDNGNGGNGGGTGSPNMVDDTLNNLGVNTGFSSRVDDKGEALPEDYRPIGNNFDVAVTKELFAIGMQLSSERPDGTVEDLEDRAAFLEFVADDTGIVGNNITEVLSPQPFWAIDTPSPHPSFGSSTPGGGSQRDLAAADLDGDGLDEIIAVFIDPDTPNFAADIQYEVLTEEATPATGTLFEHEGSGEIAVKGADFDGDGADEMVVISAAGPDVRMYLAEASADGSLTAREIVFPDYRFLFEFTPSFEVAAGNIDNDAADELVLVINEYGGSDIGGSSTYYVFDDAGTDFDTLIDGEPVIAAYDGLRIGQLSSVAVGDIDADGRDEIILAGLTNLTRNPCDSYGHILFALDDAAAGDTALAEIGVYYFSEPYIEPGTGCNTNSHTMVVRKIFLNTFDVDGDGVDEIQANRHVYEDFVDAEPFTPAGPEDAPYELPYDEILEEGQLSGGTLADATADIVTGDVTGDGREDIISYIQWRREISVWGLEGPALDTAVWKRITGAPTAFYNGQSRVYPILVAANVDKDGMALRYSEGEYHFVFTEPVLIAALAAAPCSNGIGQNIDACSTAYGISESQDLGIDGSVTIRASTFVSVEGKIPVFDVGASAEQRVTREASFSAGRSYSLEETVEYTTGPLEDTVIFTTVPLDQYVYTVVSHPDPEMVGERVVINVPRSPITLQVEREYYNQQVAEGAFKVDGNVFLHNVGDIDSYPTEADADALISTGGLGHLGPLGELVDAAGEALGPIAETLLGNGLKSSRVTTVGQGSGQTSTEIRFSETTSYRAGVEIGYDAEVSVSGGGVTVGESIGGSVGAGLSWGNAESTIYRGTVGSIDGANFAENGYSFGLFTYIYNYGDPTKPQFEVVNYWVER